MPKLFISYSHSSEKHKQWVQVFATDLREKHGVDVVLDQWGLREGDFTYAFMQKNLTDPDVKKVILICDKKYQEKADNYQGGVGDEAQIICPQLYRKVEQNKIAAVITERSQSGSAYIPGFYQGRVYIDFSDPENFKENYEKLLRWIWDRPKTLPPKIGVAPNFDNPNINFDIDEKLIPRKSPLPENRKEEEQENDKPSKPHSSILQKISAIFRSNGNAQDSEIVQELLTDTAFHDLKIDGCSYLPSHMKQCEDILRRFLHDIAQSANQDIAPVFTILNSLNTAFDSHIVSYVSDSNTLISSHLYDLSVDDIKRHFFSNYSRLFDSRQPVRLQASLSSRNRNRVSIYVPIEDTVDKNTRCGIFIYGISDRDDYDDSIGVLLNAIYTCTSHFKEIKSITDFKCYIYDALKEEYTSVSKSMYDERLEIFEQALQAIDVQFEPIVEVRPKLKEMYFWGVEALARIGDSAPTSIFKAAELWGLRFQTELDLYILARALEVFSEHIKERRKIHM